MVDSFKVDDLKTLLKSCRINPAVNQIYLSPNNIVSTQPMLDLAAEHDIRIESYWTLRCLTDENPQPVVAVVKDIAAGRGCTPDQILLAWGRAKKYASPSLLFWDDPLTS